jgi:hypothetical protein
MDIYVLCGFYLRLNDTTCIFWRLCYCVSILSNSMQRVLLDFTALGPHAQIAMLATLAQSRTLPRVPLVVLGLIQLRVPPRARPVALAPIPLLLPRALASIVPLPSQQATPFAIAASVARPKGCLAVRALACVLLARPDFTAEDLLSAKAAKQERSLSPPHKNPTPRARNAPWVRPRFPWTLVHLCAQAVQQWADERPTELISVVQDRRVRGAAPLDMF